MKKIVYAVLGTDEESFQPIVMGVYTKEEDAIKALAYWSEDVYEHFWIESYKLYNRFNVKDMEVV